MTIQQKREIAIRAQKDGESVRVIAEAMSITKSAVVRWKNISIFAGDVDFAESPRSGRPKKLTTAQQKRACGKLEADTKGVVRRVAADSSICKSTMYAYAADHCEKKKTTTEIVLSEHTLQKRVDFCAERKGADHKKEAYFDHTIVEIPPKTSGRTVFRLKGSLKPVPVRKKFKRRLSMMVYFGTSHDAISPPTFNYKRRRMKRKRPGEQNLGFRWVKHSVTAAVVKEDLRRVMFPWMKKRKLNVVLLDNAGCQDGLAEFIEDEGFESVGFGSLRRDEENGFPANSPDFMLNDAAVNKVFKDEFARACPTTLAEAMQVSKNVLKNMSRVGAKYVQNLDSLYEEVLEKEGGASHIMN